MKLSLSVLAVALCLGPIAASAQTRPSTDSAPIRTTPFPDVPKTHWAYDAVEQLRQLGILRGYPPAPARTPVKRQPAKRTRRA